MEESPYQDSLHQQMYDTDCVTKDYAEISIIMDALDDLFYPDGVESFRLHRFSADGRIMTGYFAFDYTPLSDKLWLAPSEPVHISAEHTQYLGSSAINEAYKLKIESQVTGDHVHENRINTLYYFQRVAGTEKPFSGMVVRPNICGESQPIDEQVSVYDCEILFDQIQEAISIGGIRAQVKSSR